MGFFADILSTVFERRSRRIFRHGGDDRKRVEENRDRYGTSHQVLASLEAMGLARSFNPEGPESVQ